MWLSDRRAFLLGGASALALPACQMTPALKDGGPAQALYGQVAVAEPTNAPTFLMTQHLEDRLGLAGPNAPFTLDYTLGTSSESIGTDTSGTTQRTHVAGEARYALRRKGETGALAQGIVRNFVGYSNTGNTVSTAAAAEDARQRLVRILADGIVERLYLASPDLPL